MNETQSQLPSLMEMWKLSYTERAVLRREDPGWAETPVSSQPPPQLLPLILGKLAQPSMPQLYFVI